MSDKAISDQTISKVFGMHVTQVFTPDYLMNWANNVADECCEAVKDLESNVRRARDKSIYASQVHAKELRAVRLHSPLSPEERAARIEELKNEYKNDIKKPLDEALTEAREALKRTEAEYKRKLEDIYKKFEKLPQEVRDEYQARKASESTGAKRNKDR